MKGRSGGGHRERRRDLAEKGRHLALGTGDRWKGEEAGKKGVKAPKCRDWDRVQSLLCGLQMLKFHNSRHCPNCLALPSAPPRLHRSPLLPFLPPPSQALPVFTLPSVSLIPDRERTLHGVYWEQEGVVGAW